MINRTETCHTTECCHKIQSFEYADQFEHMEEKPAFKVGCGCPYCEECYPIQQ